MGRVKSPCRLHFPLRIFQATGKGLIDAVEKFSPDKGARFETYALMRIRGNIIDKIRSQDFLPRSARKKIKDVKDAQEHLKQKLGRPATSAEVGELLGDRERKS